MREIKFRYWDTIRKEFITAGDVYLLMNGRVLAGDMDNLPLVDITENVVKSQYTGLKDVDGKEIFEGDIVRKTYKGEEVSLGSVMFSDGTYFIEIPEDGYVFLHDSHGTYQDEVIGNIYENPELLKGE